MTEVTPKPSRIFGGFEQETASELAVKLIAQQSFSALWTEDLVRFFSVKRRKSLRFWPKWGFYAARRTPTGIMRLRFAAACNPSLTTLELLGCALG